MSTLSLQVKVWYPLTTLYIGCRCLRPHGRAVQGVSGLRKSVLGSETSTMWAYQALLCNQLAPSPLWGFNSQRVSVTGLTRILAGLAQRSGRLLMLLSASCYR